MSINRTKLVRKAFALSSLTAACLITFNAQANTFDCTDIALWDPQTTYEKKDTQVQKDGLVYINKYWATGTDVPDPDAPTWANWQKQGSCEGTGPGTGPGVDPDPTPTVALVMPKRANPVSLKVKGWPSTLAMGTISDTTPAMNTQLAATQVNSIFATQASGRDMLIEPTVITHLIKQARDIEAGSTNVVLPTIGLNTVDTNDGVAADDIVHYENLVINFQNMIRASATMQQSKDVSHANPASVVLNAGLLESWQSPEFATTYGQQNTWTVIEIKKALKEAISKETSYQVKDVDGVTSALSQLYDLTALQTEVDSLIENNIIGWVQSQNFIMKRFSPDIAFGWVAPRIDGADVHATHSGLGSVWSKASNDATAFILSIQAYKTNVLQPDFLAFDKAEDDAFSAAGLGNEVYGAKQWDTYLTYVKQVTDFLDKPAMLWQIPGGHLPSKADAIPLTQVSAAGSYFMGDKDISNSVDNIRLDVTSQALDTTVYGTSSAGSVLQPAKDYDWATSRLRHAAYSNVFAIQWGGESSVSVTGSNWLQDKVVNYQDKAKIPLYFSGTGDETSNQITTIAQLNQDLAAAENQMDNEVFLSLQANGSYIPSTVYKWADFLAALSPMHNVGVADVKFWLMDPAIDDATNILYAKVAIAAFLAQSIKETIKYNVCDENNWSINTGEPIDYPMTASCGQLQQDYASYGEDSLGNDNPYSCPRNSKMEVSALTNATWYGAPGPLFAAPDAVLAEKGLLVNGNVGYWETSSWCNTAEAGPIEENKQVYDRKKCETYPGQKAGGFVWNGIAGKSVEGCGWWGRGVIQTTGRLNFGKLNHFIGRSHVDADNIGNVIQGTQVDAAPENPLYADLDLCSEPELICSSTEHGELKWIAGIFFWMNEVQGYNDVGGPYADWNYFTELKAYVDGGLVGDKFINDTSGIVNRGCPDDKCLKPDGVLDPVDGLKDRADNFKKALKAMGVNAT